MKKIFIFIIALFVICGCNDSNKINEQKNEIGTIINKEMINVIISENNYILLDVRTKEEYDERHIVSSVNIPYDEINENSFKEDINKKILVYCKSGNRAKTAVKTLTDMGYIAYNIGGIDNIELEKE